MTSATRAEAIVASAGRSSEVRLLPEPVYWGAEITDERYLLISRG